MVHRFSGKGLIRREPAESLRGPPRRAGPVIRNVRKIWRRDRESNPGARICSPLRHHSAIAPRCVGGGRFCGFCSAVNRGVRSRFEKVRTVHDLLCDAEVVIWEKRRWT